MVSKEFAFKAVDGGVVVVHAETREQALQCLAQESVSVVYELMGCEGSVTDLHLVAKALRGIPEFGVVRAGNLAQGEVSEGSSTVYRW